MIDTHAHLNFKAFNNDCDDVIRRSFSGGMRAIVIPGSNYTTSQKAIAIATAHKSCYAAVSLHPIHVTKEVFDKQKYSALVSQNKDVVKAIGETGIDLFHNPEDLALQKQIFLQHIELANELNLPIILHCRGSKENPKDAYLELIEILKGLSAPHLSQQVRGVMHCFSSDWEIAKQFLDIGFYIGFDGPITYKNASSELLKVVKKVPLGRLLLETDSPYLTPEPYRGQRNEPHYVRFIAKKIAEIKNISFEKVIKTTTQNAIKLFNLKR